MRTRLGLAFAALLLGGSAAYAQTSGDLGIFSVEPDAPRTILLKKASATGGHSAFVAR